MSPVNVNNCDFSGRSYVDPISNFSHVDIFDLGRDLPHILENEVLPAYLYLQLIHELEHHRDMTSLVGNALAILWIRATDNTGERSSAARLCDLAKILAFHHFMRPWLEGKALFAQFDAFPGPSEVLSRRSQNIFGYFISKKTTNWSSKTLNDLVDPVSKFLVARRTGKATVDMKADLLISGTGLDDGGYLTGYLACRRFVSLCQARSAIARDSDFTVDYLHHFLLRDWYLAEVLLTEHSSPETAVQAVADYTINRIALIESRTFQDLIDTELSEYEKATNGPAETPDEIFKFGKPELGSLFYDRNTCFDAFGVYQDWIEWVLRRAQEASVLLDPRPFFRLGSVTGTLSVDNSGLLSMDCVDEVGPWQLCARTDLDPRGTITSEMNLMLIPSLSSQFINFTSGGQFLWANLPDSHQGTLVQHKIETLIFEAVSQQKNIRDRSDKLTTAMLESGEFLNDIVLRHRTRVESAFNSFTAQHILQPGHQLSKSTDELLRDSGVWGVLGRDPVGVRTLAFLGVLGSCSDDATRKPNVRADDLSQLASDIGADVRPEYLEDLESRARASGLTLFGKWRDRHWSRL